MESNSFLKELVNLHPELREDYESEQYKLSKEIISLVMQNDLTINKIVEISNITKDQYYRMESGDCSINVGSYNKFINEIKDYVRASKREG